MSRAMKPCDDCGCLIRKPALRCRSCHDRYQHGENNPAWKGGISKDPMNYKRIQRERYPERIRARTRVRDAIRAGRLTRQSCNWPGCDVGSDATQAHHWSYEKGYELDVTFFCLKHHRLVDQMSREQFKFIRSMYVQKAIRRVASRARRYAKVASAPGNVTT